MAIEVFNRYEQKYLLDDTTYRELIRRLSDYMKPDSYSEDGGFYQVSNIYYDTEDDLLIRKSIDKPVYKEKIRLRAYGIPNAESKVFVEIKKKYKGIVNKRRTTMTLQSAVDFLNRNVVPSDTTINPQVLKELDYLKKNYTLTPKVYISYDRRAYYEKENEEFRVTFDHNLLSRRTDLDLTKEPYGEALLQPGQWLMEVKITWAMPLWFTRILSDLHIYPATYSKYGIEYKNYITTEYEKGIQHYVSYYH